MKGFPDPEGKRQSQYTRWEPTVLPDGVGRQAGGGKAGFLEAVLKEEVRAGSSPVLMDL